MNRTTLELLPDANGLSQAAGLLRGGGLVAFPTETVYGLGADARNGLAVAKVYEAKGRPGFNPLIVHVADLATARSYARFDTPALALAQAFWPGPLTIVLPLKPDAGLSSLVTAGLDSVALRVPAHPLGQALLAAFDGPIAAPSANMSGTLSPTSARHVLDGLSGRIDAVLMGQVCEVGVESTIISVQDGDVALLRPGGVPVEEIETALGQAILRPTDPQTPKSPGQLLSHYAPVADIRLNVIAPHEAELLLGFGAVKDAVLNLSPTADLAEAAANLFTFLRSLDDMVVARGRSRIAVSPVPELGLGLAINDRLRRAAAPRT